MAEKYALELASRIAPRRPDNCVFTLLGSLEPREERCPAGPKRRIG